MVLVPGGVIELWVLGGVAAERSVALDPFLIDRTEVTNREFARFVAAGGYAHPEFWAKEFRDGGRTLAFAEAMVRFRDATGRPGPATWKLGGPADGADDLPVEGLSWYEADAYARFMGKELPTLYHWYWADTAGDLQLLPGLMLRAANFEGRGPHRVSDARGLGAHGARDMAGNVREWCANTIENGTRLALGGAWNDPAYVYLIPELRSPFDRAEGNGVRCAKRLAAKDLPAVVTRPLKRAVGTDYFRLRPVSNEVYSVLARFYDRQKVPLDTRIESTDDSSPHWIKEKVSYAAGYGGERMTAYLYRSRTARPPYQVVLQMAGSSTFGDTTSSATESDIFGWSYADYLIRGGRAVLIPLWKGSYERSDGFHPLEAPVTPYREHVGWWVAELRQSIDYLESRKDIDPQTIGYQGISFGSVWAPLFMALEPRLRCGILLLGGFSVMPGPSKPFPPEMEPLNFAPRVKAPVLMLNGRDDAIFPYETAQVPLFRVLGTPQDRKRHVTFPGGHSVFGWRDQLHREGLDWLDRHFGPPAGAAPAPPPTLSPK
jgi:formylglycine-generating enzyme required for sulfatase activity/dienelactone hydrolase